MITWMQKNRKFLVPTLWISAIAFIGSGAVGWGKYSYGSASGDSVAKVGDIEISSGELQSTTNNLFNYYNNLFGGKLTKEQAQGMHLQENALSKLTNDALLLNYANEIGIVALDEEVLKEYTSINAFKTDGKFSKSKYEQILRAQGINKKLFEKQIRKSVVLKKLKSLLSLPATKLEKEALFAGKSLQDHLMIKKITKDLSSITASDDELKKFWETKKDNYKSKISYVLESIKVPIDGIEVNESELKEFYDANKFKFKDEKGKIKPLESAKELVTKAVQLKKAKSKTLKKYLALKKGKIKADTELVVDATNAPFDLRELASLKAGSFIKTLELKDGYLTGKLKAVNTPKTLEFEKAKDLALVDLKAQKSLKALETEASEILKKPIEGATDLGFVSPNDAQKLKDLDPMVASGLLREVFTKPDKKGFFIDKNSAYVYEIKEQKLFDKDAFTKESDVLVKNIDGLKSNSIEDGLVNSLKKRYKIEQLVQFTKKEG